MRLEWAKCRARAHRFREEVEILSEEMSRILRFFAYKAADWKEKGKVDGWPSMSSARAEAHRAYAERQSAMYLALQNHCAQLWRDLPGFINRMNAIIEDPTLADPGEFDFARSKAMRGGGGQS